MLGGQLAVLVMPQTFMNLAVSALPRLFERFEASAGDLIVVYDDIASAAGKVANPAKRFGGRAQWGKIHDFVLGSDEFLRVRVGILPERPVGRLRDFVLSRVAKGRS